MAGSFFTLVLLVVLSACPAKIAVYRDKGVNSESARAGEKAFRWMGYRVRFVDARRIESGRLAGFGLLCYPDGDVYSLSQQLTPAAVQNVADFVRSGGGVIGIDGGAALMCERVYYFPGKSPGRTLQLLPGVASLLPADWWRRGEQHRRDPPEMHRAPRATVSKTAITDRGHPITESGPGTYSVGHWQETFGFFEQDGGGVHVLGCYEDTSFGSLVAMQYGKGRIFASFVQCEREENGARDGLPASARLVDPDSGWDLLKRATHWVLSEKDTGAADLRSLWCLLALFAYLAAVAVAIVVSQKVRKKSRGAAQSSRTIQAAYALLKR